MLCGSGSWLGRGRSAAGTEALFSGADRACQTAVINAVGVVPKGLAQLDTSTKHFNLVGAARRRIRRDEFLVPLGHEVLVMPVPQNRFKNVLALAHKINFPVHTLGVLVQPANHNWSMLVGRSLTHVSLFTV